MRHPNRAILASPPSSPTHSVSKPKRWRLGTILTNHHYSIESLLTKGWSGRKLVLRAEAITPLPRPCLPRSFFRDSASPMSAFFPPHQPYFSSLSCIRRASSPLLLLRRPSLHSPFDSSRRSSRPRRRTRPSSIPRPEADDDDHLLGHVSDRRVSSPTAQGELRTKFMTMRPPRVRAVARMAIIWNM